MYCNFMKNSELHFGEDASVLDDPIPEAKEGIEMMLRRLNEEIASCLITLGNYRRSRTFKEYRQFESDASFEEKFRKAREKLDKLQSLELQLETKLEGEGSLSRKKAA